MPKLLCRLHSEKRNPRPPRNHHAVTKRFEDFFNYALYEAPEKYKKTPAVVVAEAYTNSFMVMSRRTLETCIFLL